MAKYTVELGSLIESNFNIGLQDYPIYKEELRKPLNDLIIEHFYFREIGLETPQLFKRFLNRKMNEIMPYYNQLYKSEDLEFNPLYNIELTETFEQTENKSNLANADTNVTKDNSINNTNTNNVTSNGNNEDINVESDTPQTEITLDEIKNNKYASKTNLNTSKSEGTSLENGESSSVETGTEIAKNKIESNENGSQTYTRKTEGSSAGLSFSNAISQWRKIMININMQIIEELEPLFMQIW